MGKYSLRFWVDVLWSAAGPEAWFYETGYVQLANYPYTADVAQAAAHVANLAQLPANLQGVLAKRPRMYSLQAYQRSLSREHGVDLFRERILPKLEEAAARVIGAVRPAEPT